MELAKWQYFTQLKLMSLQIEKTNKCLAEVVNLYNTVLLFDLYSFTFNCHCSTG